MAFRLEVSTDVQILARGPNRGNPPPKRQGRYAGAPASKLFLPGTRPEGAVSTDADREPSDVISWKEDLSARERLVEAIGV